MISSISVSIEKVEVFQASKALTGTYQITGGRYEYNQGTIKRLQIRPLSYREPRKIRLFLGLRRKMPGSFIATLNNIQQIKQGLRGFLTWGL